jgi:hypothetical protein
VAENGLGALATRMRERADAVETSASRLAVIGAKAAVETLVYITPVDTSEHLSNWQVRLNQAAGTPLPPFYMGKQGSTRGASAQQAIAEANGELAGKTPGQVIYISNLGPAIVRLDNGWSGQFPGGFVPRARVSFLAAVQDAVAAGALFNDRMK